MEASHYSFGVCGSLRNFRKFHSTKQSWMLVSNSHHKRLGLVCKLGGVEYIVSYIDRYSDMACICMVGEGRAQQKNNGFFQHFCLGESCLSSPHPEARQLSSSPYIPGNFSAAAPVLEI